MPEYEDSVHTGDDRALGGVTLHVSRRILRACGVVSVVLIVTGAAFAAGRLTSVSGRRGGAPTPAPTATVVTVYEPIGPSGVVAGVTVTSIVSGWCWETSVAASSRADAWRCSAGNLLWDPCFSSEHAAMVVACPHNYDPERVTLIDLTRSLPAPVVSGLPLTPWMFCLPGGACCEVNSSMVGPSLDGLRNSGECSTMGGSSFLWYGSVHQNTNPWTVMIGEPNSRKLVSERVSAAWE